MWLQGESIYWKIHFHDLNDIYLFIYSFIYLLLHTYIIYNTLRTLITILKQLLTLLTVLHLLTLHYNTCLMPIYILPKTLHYIASR